MKTIELTKGFDFQSNVESYKFSDESNSSGNHIYSENCSKTKLNFKSVEKGEFYGITVEYLAIAELSRI